jgi:NAD(P)-dependent dehydrogenase (short-subunit alcohol dehydrogenase family)
MSKLRKVIFRKQMAAIQDLKGKSLIVTGASENSIGYATVISILKMGAFVTISRRSDTDTLVQIIQSRFPKYADQVKGHDLDLSSKESVHTFCLWYKTTGQALDVLINNAGIHLDLLSKWKEPRMSEDGYEVQWRTNYLGTFQLTMSLFPLLKESGEVNGDARIVNVVSMLHKKGLNVDFTESTREYNSWNAYGQSKLALVHMTKSIQKRFKEVGVQSYCLHPGEVFTNIAGKGLIESKFVTFTRNMFAFLEKFMLMTPEEGAQTSIHCATNPDAIGGLYYVNCKSKDSSEDSYDECVSDQLWEKQNTWVKGL